MCQRESVNEGFLIGCEVLLGHAAAPPRVTIDANALNGDIPDLLAKGDAPRM
jgi:hypothetical protein